MIPQNLTFVTGSADKVREAEQMLGVRLVRHDLELPERQDVDVEQVVGEKARLAWEALGRQPAMVDDTGLAFRAWNGLPGALVKWFVKSVGVAGICRMLDGFDDRTATATTVVAVYDGELRTFVGSTPGRIALQPAGEHGFGWDPVFIPDGADRTFAQMDPGEKSVYSMRRKALEKMAVALRG